MSTVTWVGFAVAGGLGAVSRYVVDLAISRRLRQLFPWGVFVINVSGSLLLGFLTGLGLYHGLDNDVRLVAGTGFCGAYTTFSTFSVQTVRLLEAGKLADAMRNVVGTVVACAIAAAAGLAVAHG